MGNKKTMISRRLPITLNWPGSCPTGRLYRMIDERLKECPSLEWGGAPYYFLGQYFFWSELYLGVITRLKKGQNCVKFI